MEQITIILDYQLDVANSDSSNLAWDTCFIVMHDINFYFIAKMPKHEMMFFSFLKCKWVTLKCLSNELSFSERKHRKGYKTTF